MTKIKFIIIVLLSLNSNYIISQNINILKDSISKILTDKDAIVGISILGINSKDTISINGNKKLPMQSVYKYHLALTVLNQVDQGKLSLNDTIKITKQHIDTPLWSLIRKKLPNGGKLTLGQIIKYTVANSDNVGCDILFDLIGGPSKVENYMRENSISEIAIKHNEAIMQSDWELQYENWTTPNEATKALKTFYDNKQQELSTENHSFLWGIMKKSWFGKISMKSYIPENTIVAHKTGHSGKNDNGLTGAQNDIGIIFLPNGNHFYLSILISNSNETSEVNQKLIANITRLTYDYFEHK